MLGPLKRKSSPPNKSLVPARCTNSSLCTVCAELGAHTAITANATKVTKANVARSNWTFPIFSSCNHICFPPPLDCENLQEPGGPGALSDQDNNGSYFHLSITVFWMYIP